MAASNNKRLLLGFPEYSGPARQLAAAAGLDYADIEVHRFPDGESRLRLPEVLPERIVIYRSLDQANEKLVELALAASTARELGAGDIVLVAPYLCYMRQDKAFHPGEAVSQHVVGKMIASWFDGLVTVDPHLHRIHRLDQAVPVATAKALNATEAMAGYLDGRLDNPLLIGPDEESEQWVAAIAHRNQIDYQVARKLRFGDNEVQVTLPDADYRGRNIVLVDDVASTGRTLEAASRDLIPCQPASITVMVTHALFVGDAEERLRNAGVNQIWSCDSIIHPTNRIRLTETLAQAL
ncbi:MAG: ribose-phosphate diphosphokinase [Pseudomonadota bacterium]|nr:ribose-phosphate diphosphokinase [Pseudomonadota bacterium]